MESSARTKEEMKNTKDGRILNTERCILEASPEWQVGRSYGSPCGTFSQLCLDIAYGGSIESKTMHMLNIGDRRRIQSVKDVEQNDEPSLVSVPFPTKTPRYIKRVPVSSQIHLMDKQRYQSGTLAQSANALHLTLNMLRHTENLVRMLKPRLRQFQGRDKATAAVPWRLSSKHHLS